MANNTSSKTPPKSLRLDTILHMLPRGKVLWDVGCDHGAVGLRAAELYPEIEEIHLVDPAGPVIEKLKNTQASHIASGFLFHLHQQTGQTLQIPTSNNIIVIAGMGGNTISEILAHLRPQLDASSHVLISPHRDILKLRAELASSWRLQNERVVEERGLFYEILHLHPSLGEPITPFGHNLWHNPVGARYRQFQLNKLAQHRDQETRDYLSFLSDSGGFFP